MYFEFQARPNKAEIGWREAKVPGDLLLGISPTAPRSYFTLRSGNYVR
jgi:hypothetical protein